MNIQPLSISKRKLFASLSQSKHRKEHSLFIVEGAKAIGEMLDSPFIEVSAIIGTQAWWESNDRSEVDDKVERYAATAKDMRQLSGLVSAPDVVGIFKIPFYNFEIDSDVKGQLVLALDDVQDPGNMGTIIRLADWWGVETIVCSRNTVDCFNPKVVQSAMGALGRVKVIKVDSLSSVLEEVKSKGICIYGTFMEGENIFTDELCREAVVVMGNEGNGVSPEVAAVVGRRLTIPSYPAGRRHVESLNVATATAVILAQFRFGKGLG